MPIKVILRCILVIAIGCILVITPQVNINDYPQSTITSKFLFFSFGCLIVFGILIVKRIFSKFKPFSISELDIVLLLLVGYISLNRYDIHQRCVHLPIVFFFQR